MARKQPLDKDHLYELLEEEREKSNKNYAVKLVEKIVFTTIAIICTSVIVAILAKVISN